MAEGLGAQWIAAHVETPAHLRLPQEARDRVVQTLRLAEQLGAETVTLSGEKMREAILAFARDRNVTKIIVGKPTRQLWKRLLLGSIVDALVQGSGDIDIYVISGEREDASPIAPVRRREIPIDWPAYGQATAIVALTTGVAWLMSPLFELADLVMVYLLGIVVVAMRHGRGPSLVASILSVAAFDLFFVPPYFTFAVSDVRHIFTFAVMLIVGFVISGLTARIRAQALAARDREQRTAALYAMSRELASTRGVDELLTIAVRHISEVFRSQVVVLLPDAVGRLAPWSGGQFQMDANDLGVGRWVFEHRQPAGLGTATLPGASALYLPLLASRGPVGVLGVRPADRHALDAPEQLHQLETFGNQTAPDHARPARSAAGGDRRRAHRAGAGQPPRQRDQVHAARKSDQDHRDRDGPLRHRRGRRPRPGVAPGRGGQGLREVLPWAARRRPGRRSRPRDLPGHRQGARGTHLGPEPAGGRRRVPLHVAADRKATGLGARRCLSPSSSSSRTSRRSDAFFGPR